ncbi:hypothetical protein C0995_007606 [Termitomyces sp. Mi166|nr:hypothetical protein C0995_007606 [Termitomyces sp. Mi166\
MSKKQPSQTKHAVTVESEADIDMPSNSPTPPISSKQPKPSLLRKCIIITSFKDEDDVLSDSNKWCQFSPLDASEDSVGSSNDYKEGQDKDKSKTAKGKNSKGKSKIKVKNSLNSDHANSSSLLKFTKTSSTFTTKQII